MAWGKKPWQGGSKNKTYGKGNRSNWGSSLVGVASSTSQYQSRKEYKNTLKGFLVLAGFMIGTISIIHLVAKFL
jgi:hypothetical protein